MGNDKDNSQYENMGIETDKGYIGKIFANGVSNEYPGSWVNIITDLWDPNYVLTMHGDGVGSATLSRLLCYYETNDVSYLRGDLVNAFEMNMDIAAAGFTDNIIAVDIVAINKDNVPKTAYLEALNEDFSQISETYAKYGTTLTEGKRVVRLLGGESADLPDQTPNCILDVAFFSRMPRENIISGNTKPGDVIFGIASGGTQAIWEEEINYGTMSNGATHLRVNVFHPDYNDKYPFLVGKNSFNGHFKADEYIAELGTTAGKAVTSPCRHVGLIMKLIIDALKNCNALHLLSGIALVSGGGLKKVINLGHGIRYQLEMKDEMILPIFKLVQQVSKESTFKMFKTYNNGIGIQVVGSPEGGILEAVVRMVCENINVGCYKLGECFPSEHPEGKNEVVIYDPQGNDHYYDK